MYEILSEDEQNLIEEFTKGFTCRNIVVGGQHKQNLYINFNRTNKTPLPCIICNRNHDSENFYHITIN